LGKIGLSLNSANSGAFRAVFTLVTGSFIKKANQADFSSPVRVIGAEDIEKTGFTDIDDLLVLNPANTGSFGGLSDLTQGVPENRSARGANLRGLGSGATLVLLNGKRVASQEQDSVGNNFVNLAGLVPMIAVDRIETVLDGAGPLYGSDAVGGVMNIITSKKYDGFSLSAQNNFVDTADSYNVQAKIGASGENSRGMLAVSFEHMNPMQNSDRDFGVENFSSFGQPGSYGLTARPVSTGGGDLVIDGINYSTGFDAGSTLVADPGCEDNGGILAGGLCRFDFQPQNPIRPESDVFLMYGNMEYDILDSHVVSLEARHYRQEGIRRGVTVPITNYRPLVPASNPYNPFGVDVEFRGRPFGANGDSPATETSDINATHIVAGLEGDISDNWTYSLSGTWSQETAQISTPDTDVVAFTNALNGFGGENCSIDGFGNSNETAGSGNCVYLNPFGSGHGTNDPRTLFNFITQGHRRTEVNMSVLDFVVSGDLFELSGGTAGIAIGAQYREEERSVDFDAFLESRRQGFRPVLRSGTGSRSGSALFAEAFLPLMETLDAQVAVRYEEYDSFSSVDPKVGLNWRVTDEISLRGSYSTSFKAPALAQSVGNQATSSVGEIVDPLDPTDLGGNFRSINAVSNPNLDPEESTNFNIGSTFNVNESLQFDIDYWSYDFEGRITRESAQSVVNASPNGSQVIRDGNGDLLGVDVGFFNSGNTKTTGLDFAVTYNTEVGNGKLSFTNLTTFISSYDIQATQDSEVIDAVGNRNATNPGSPTPELRSNTFINWSQGNHDFGITARYVSAYDDDRSPGDEVDSQWEFDAQYGILLGAEEQYKLTIGAINLLDEEPPFAATNGYEPSVYSPLGRQVYLRMNVNF